ncbi:MAG: Sensor protein [Naasia sp.]|nr:Sensor protein [Naasia sp.]
MTGPRSLRFRLGGIVVGLLAAVLVAVLSASVLVLRENLMAQLDAQVEASARRAAAEIGAPVGPPPDGSGYVSTPGQSAETVAALLLGGEVVSSGYLDAEGEQRELDADAQAAIVTVPADGEPHTVDLGGELGGYRVLAVEGRTGIVLVIGQPMRQVESAVGTVTAVGAVIALVLLALAGAAAALSVNAALRPLRRVAATAASVAELPLDRGAVDLAIRVPPQDTDPRTEVGQVGAALDRLLGHVGTALAARAESEDKVRRFVADASHELRTPLASIRGYAELTRRTQPDLTEDVQRNLARIESESIRMQGLVEDLLLLARLDSRRELECEEVDLSQVVVEAVGDAHAAGPAHAWVLDVPEEPLTVTGDEPRLRQVVVNLLANARVHTPAGTTVTIFLARQPDGAVTLRVADDGPGIDTGVAADLFERFTRGDASRHRATGSTGLGLSIVRGVVEAHGGAVEVASEPGSTMFTVTLPRREPTR